MNWACLGRPGWGSRLIHFLSSGPKVVWEGRGVGVGCICLAGARCGLGGSGGGRRRGDGGG